MPPPWERYQQQSQQAGPWQQYQQQPAPEQPRQFVGPPAPEQAQPRSRTEAVMRKLGVLPFVGQSEFLANMATGMIATPIAHVAAAGREMARSPGDPVTGDELAQSITDRFIYQPRTESGQNMQRMAETAMQPVGRAINYAISPTEGTQSEQYAPGRHLATAAVGLLPFKGGMRPRPSAAPRAAPSAGPVASGADIIARARAARYILDPRQVVDGAPVGGVTQRALAVAGGKAALPAEASLKNQVRTNQLFAEDLGIRGGETLTPARLTAERVNAVKAYTALEDLKNSRGAPFSLNLARDGQYLGALRTIRSEAMSRVRGTVDPKVEGLVRQLSRPQNAVDIRSVMREIRDLRHDARLNFKADAPETVRLARSQKQAANALEDAIERQVGGLRPELVSNFRAARTQLAKLELAEDALKGLDIDASVIARARRNGDLVTGNAALIADMADNFPHVMQTGARVGQRAGMGLLDLAMSVPTLGAWAGGRYAAGKLSTMRPGDGVRLPNLAPAAPVVSNALQQPGDYVRRRNALMERQP